LSANDTGVNDNPALFRLAVGGINQRIVALGGIKNLRNDVLII